MISLALAVLRLLGVIAAVIWLPGFIATRRPVFPLRTLHLLLVGVFIHTVALVVSTAVTHRVTPALWLVPAISLAIALLVRVTAGPIRQGADPPALSVQSQMALAGIVLAAAVLRWFHNFHYDDTAHFIYLTDIARENTLFPDPFYLDLTHLDLGGLGSGSVQLSRYPYWAVSYTVLARLAGIPLGDGYLLLGLGVLTLTLGYLTALAERIGGSRAGLLWLFVLLATSLYVNDNLLNFGGYPFQVGKLFVLLAAASFMVAWSTGDAKHLLGAVAGLFIGPLLHTNNSIGTVVVAALALVVAIARPALRRPTIGAVGIALTLLTLAAAVSVGTGGFLRWTSVGPAQPQTAAVVDQQPDDPVTEAQGPTTATVTPVPPPRDFVLRRMVLFLDRGTPSELILVVLGALVIPRLGRLRRYIERLTPIGIVIAAAITALVSGSELVRAVVTSTYKPGYFVTRDALLGAAPLVANRRDIVTDPITDVLGRAAGWPQHDEPALSVQEQTARIALFHPAVRGGALKQVVQSFGPATIVVNERILGRGAGAKFDGIAGMTRLGQTAGSPATDTHVETRLGGFASDLSTLSTRDRIEHALALVPVVWQSLTDGAPIVVFGSDAPPRALDTSSLGDRVRLSHANGTVWPYLNSAIVTMPPVTTCVNGASITVNSGSSFVAPLVVVPLDPIPQTTRQQFTLRAGRAQKRFGLRTPLCDERDVSFLIHTDYWWDARFTVESASWEPATKPANGG